MFIKSSEVVMKMIFEILCQRLYDKKHETCKWMVILLVIIKIIRSVSAIIFLSSARNCFMHIQSIFRHFNDRLVLVMIIIINNTYTNTSSFSFEFAPKKDRKCNNVDYKNFWEEIFFYLIFTAN
jgi:hypothetical protein